MPELFLLAQIIGIYFVAALFPGPNLLLVVKNAALVSRRAGIATGIGIAATNAIWIFTAAAGFANFIFKIPHKKTARKIKCAGFPFSKSRH